MYTLSGAFTSKASAATNGTRSVIGSAKTSGAFPFGVVRRESEPYCAELIKYLWEATGSNRLFAQAMPSAPWMLFQVRLPAALGETVPLSCSEPTMDVASFASTHIW